MEEILTGNDALKASFELGYICKNGEMFSPKGNKVGRVDKASGYPQFSIKFKKKVCNIKCHRLVAYQKYGNSLFDNGIVVRHLDGNKLNFKEDNIAIGTQRDNIFDRKSEDRIKYARNASKNIRKFSDEIINVIDWLEEECLRFCD